MITTADRRARLWARHHLDRPGADLRATVRALVAVHSSDPITPHLGLWARVRDYRTSDLHDAIDAGDLWRLHAMRRTLWVVPSVEAPIFDGAAGRAIAVKERRRLVTWIAAERDGAEAWLDEVEQAVVDAVRPSPGISTKALKELVPGLALPVLLGSGKWAMRSPVGSRVLFLLAMQGRLFRTSPAGTFRSSQYGWSVPADGYGPRMDDADARAALLSRYVRRFGPVTTTDIRWWSGWTVRHTRAALAAVDAVEVTLDDGTGWVLPHDTATSEPPPRGVALLPGLDPTPMGFKERDWFLGPHGPTLFDRNGNIGPTVWVDGHLVGGWAIRDDGRVVTRLLEDADADAVTAEADRLTAWLDGVSATPRFRTPLERELTG